MIGTKHYGTGTSQVRHGCARHHSCNTAITSYNRGAEPRTCITVKTVAKWRKCETVEDRKTRPTHPSSMVLNADEEAMIVAFRRHTRLPTDDCLYALQPTIPHLTRSSLYRCWAAAWNIATSRDGRRQAQTAKVQALPCGIFPYRHRRIAHQRR